MDPLQRLIGEVKAVCPDADIARGAPLSSGTPTVRVLRVPGQSQPSLWLYYYESDSPTYKSGYVVDGWVKSLDAAVTECLRFLNE